MRKVFIILFVALSCIGCTNENKEANLNKCSQCEEYKVGDMYTITHLEKSYTEYICNDCIKDFKPLIESIGGVIVSNSGADIDEIVDNNLENEDEINADEYYDSHSNVLEIIEVSDSDNVKTEKEVTDLLVAKGFNELDTYALYTMEGQLTEEIIENNTNEKYPIYETQYLSKSNEIWTITIVDDVIMAFPVSFNLQSKLGVELIVSENEYVMSYDSKTNKFYKNIPNETTAHIKVVDRIDATTLDSLTIEVLNEE